LSGRIVFGASSAALLASSRGRSRVVAGVIGAITAAIGAKVAYESRADLGEHLPDVAIGLAEGVLVPGLAAAATRL
jgi:hypothetical protein